MKFYSDIEANLGVWDGSRMIEFANGEYETSDKREIEILLSAGCRHDADPDVFKKECGPVELTELTNKELKALLDEKGIEYDSRAKKQVLIDLLTEEETDSDDKDPVEDLDEDEYLDEDGTEDNEYDDNEYDDNEYDTEGAE